MPSRLRNASLAVCALSVLLACSAQSPPMPEQTTSAATASSNPQLPEDSPPLPVPAAVDTPPPTAGPTPAAGDTMPVAGPQPVPPPARGRKPPPQMSDPLPPEQLRQAVQLDRSCRTDADCTVKNVGNCCGAYPACVNRNSPTDPAAVQAQCQREGRSSVCGFKEVSGCQCVQGQCQDVSDGPVAQ